MPVLVLLLAAILAGCSTLLRPALPESEAQLRARKAVRDLETAGFRLPGEFDLDWSDRSVRCSAGNACASPVLDGDRRGRLLLAPEALLSDPRLRLALLEVWQRLSDGGKMQGPRAFSRSTLRQLVSGPRVGVSDPVLLGEVLDAYRGYRAQIGEEGRAGLPDPDTYSRELGLFLVPVSLPQPDEGAERSFAPRALGALPVFDCEAATRNVHAEVDGWEGRWAYGAAVCAEEAGDLTQAIEHLLAAERRLVHDPRVPLALGEILCVAGHRRAALLAFERAAQKSPRDEERADAYRGIARCHLRGNDPMAARAAYLEALALDPDDVLTAGWLRRLEEEGLLPAR